MEIFRRLGLAQKRAQRRAAGGLPERHRLSHDGHRHRAVAHPDSLPARPLHRDRAGPTPEWPTPEPPHRINQIYLEPILFAHAAADAGITILNRTAFEDFVEDNDGAS